MLSQIILTKLTHVTTAPWPSPLYWSGFGRKQTSPQMSPMRRVQWKDYRGEVGRVNKTNVLRHPETGNMGWLLLQLGLKGQRKHELIPVPVGTMDGALLRGATVIERSPYCQRCGPSASREEGGHSLAFFSSHPPISCSASYRPWTQPEVSQQRNPSNALYRERLPRAQSPLPKNGRESRE